MKNLLNKINGLLEKINSLIDSLFEQMKKLSDFVYEQVNDFAKQAFAVAVCAGIGLVFLAWIISLIKF
tara:strand:- start:304 stop:507 length:204 start_codon:yes stop_codon:yes gene_type:complete